MSESKGQGAASRPSRSIAAPAYIFVCCFLAGPAFGLLAMYLIYVPFGAGSVSLEAAIAAYAMALIFGGIQGYRAGLRLTEQLDENGYVSLRHVVKTTARIAFTPSALFAILAFVQAWAAHDLRGLFLWPAQAFAASVAVHAFAALCVSALIFPLMRQPKHRLPAQ